MVNEIIILVTSILAILLSIGAITISAIALIKCIASEKSTHSVHFQPIDEALKNNIEEWSTTDDSLKKQRTMYKEDVQDNLPEFADSEEDTKIYSF